MSDSERSTYRICRAESSHECRRLFRSSGAEIQSHERQRAYRFAPGNEFIRPKLIRVYRIPGLVQYARSILLRSDTIKPVVAGNKVAAGVTNDGNTEFTNFIHYVLAKTVRVRELRSGIVDPFIDRSSEVFKK